MHTCIVALLVGVLSPFPEIALLLSLIGSGEKTYVDEVERKQ